MVVEISDWNDLDNVRNDLDGDYVLVNDLDSSTAGYTGIGDDFEPIGFIPDDDFGFAFGGSFDGDGFQISDVVIEYDDEGDIGLFASASGALIENLSVDGSVTVTNGGRLHGGLVGIFRGDIVQNCVSHVDVTSDGDRVAGLLGQNNGLVTDSYATGSVVGSNTVGGLVGRNDADAGSAEIQRSYAVGLVSGNSNVGGLVAEDRDGTAIVEDSYWDTEATEQSTSAGGTGLTTDEMQGSEAETNMTGFDFANVWNSVLESDADASADGYPILIAADRENQLNAQGILVPTVDITGQITLDETGVGTADVIGFNLTNNEFGGKTETDTEGNYTLTVAGTEEGSGDTIAVAVDFDDGTERYGRLVTTVLE